MSLLTAEDRALVERARQIKAAKRKADKRARPAKVRPTAEGQRQPRVQEPLYLAFIRRQPCAALHMGGCEGAIQAAHVRFSDASKGRRNSGMQQKPDDRFTAPLCEAHHLHDQHRGSEAAFWRRIGVDPADLMARLSAQFDGPTPISQGQ